MNLRVTLMTLCLGGVSVVSLFAHDLYVWPETFRPEKGQHFVLELHNGDSFPESEGPPPIARLCDTNMVTANGSHKLDQFREEHKALLTDVFLDGTGSFIITACLSANSRSYDPGKFARYLDDEGLTMIAKYRQEHGETDKPAKEIYSKYAKAMLVTGSPTGLSTKPVGMKIEIVPAVDPATLKPGESLPIQVLFEGKPAPGLRVDTAWLADGPAKTSVAGTTDQHGRIRLPLQKGQWRITTGISNRYKDQSVANWETFFATLTFEVSPVRTSRSK